jgi:pyrroline-5-carboxylate reductase
VKHEALGVIAADARLWLVGAGNMGAAMLARWIDGAVVRSDQVTVIDPGAPVVPAGVRLLDAPPAQETADILVLAIKPQLLDQVAPTLAHARPGLLISILAGVEQATLAARIPATAIVRAMPNLPVSLGRGVIALHASAADPAARATAEALMTPLGLVEWIADETLFHAVTALSGSGPGFVYRFVEALAAASVETPATLADRVASPRGTTRAGLDVLDAGDAMMTLVAATLAAAANRSEELAAAAR